MPEGTRLVTLFAPPVKIRLEGWQPLTPEALVASDPDVYLEMDRGIEVVGGIEGLLEIPSMEETKAGQRPFVISHDRRRERVWQVDPLRHHRPQEAEIDIDIVRHGHEGQAGKLLRQAEPGDLVALLGPRMA